MHTGDQIAAAGTVIGGEVETDESLLSGESDLVYKRAVIYSFPAASVSREMRFIRPKRSQLRAMPTN
ncbi:hypothetical protein HT585_28675 [Ensifer sp. HO-A22]|uniref:P-type ATPase A domain-containing protein n=1 Tax=Ensifer oleiphilus TaxID=2742698 RepID=A0A7Y6QBY7_9HYPH|nr:hypothetical protein [Ensifer oleiphilus]